MAEHPARREATAMPVGVRAAPAVARVAILRASCPSLPGSAHHRVPWATGRATTRLRLRRFRRRAKAPSVEAVAIRGRPGEAARLRSRTVEADSPNSKDSKTGTTRPAKAAVSSKATRLPALSPPAGSPTSSLSLLLGISLARPRASTPRLLRALVGGTPSRSLAERVAVPAASATSLPQGRLRSFPPDLEALAQRPTCKGRGERTTLPRA